MKKFITFFIILFSSLSIFAQSPASNIVITEIYFNAPNSGIDSLEYVEIYNKGTEAVSLQGFTFRSAFIDTLPNVELAPNSFYVVTYDDVFFQKATKTTARKWKSGSLSNNGESIQLWHKDGTLIDSVLYRVAAPWPTTANGNGPGIELCDVTANNDNGSNWKAAITPIGYSLNNLNGQAIPMLGTPGKANTVTCSGGGGGTGTFVARNIRIQTNRNTNANVNLAQQNQIPNNQITSSAIVSQPKNGTATKQAGGGGGTTNTLIYSPNAGFVGRDSFEYSLCTAAGCDTAKILVNVIEPIFNSSSIGKVTAVTNPILQTPDSLNRNVELIGIVHSPNFSTNGLQFTFIDQKFKADGIEAARATKVGGYTLTEGDKLRIRGRIAQNQGINRIVIDTLFKMEDKIKQHEPLSVSVLEEYTENMIVKLEGVSIVDSTKWTTTGTANFFIVEVVDGTNTKFNVRIDKDITELANWTAPKGKFDLIGVGYQGQIQTTGGGGGITQAYMIMPRYIKDFVFSTKTNDLNLGKFINIYPNPFSEQVLIQLTNSFDAIEIYDIYGKLIQKINHPSENQLIKTENWETGIYLMKAIKDNKQFVSKIVKQ